MTPVQIDFSFGPEGTGTLEDLVEEFNDRHEGMIRVKYRERPEDTADYLDRLRPMFHSASGRIDVIGGDIIWPAKFASKGWIADLSNCFPHRSGANFSMRR